MSLFVFGIILFSAALHATWNAVVKGGDDKLQSMILVAAFGAIPGILLLPFLPPIAPAAWPYLAISVILEIAYSALVAAAYSHADMSRAYPLMRGTPPLIVALVSTIALGIAISPVAWLGIGLVSIGLLSLTLRGTGGDAHGIGFAFVNALVIASYTLVDSFGVRASGAPITYTMWIFVLVGVPLTLWGLLRRPRFVAYARRDWKLGLIGGLGTLGSYGIVLWAMTQVPVPIVAALRETSILFGTAIAAFILRERVTPARIIAVLIIAVGAAVLKFA
jgi:drug/metabolite transporter (DMT)-like permease